MSASVISRRPDSAPAVPVHRPIGRWLFAAVLVAGAITSIFLAGQILWVYRAPVDPVTVGSPVSGEWYVVHGGRSELVNGHNTAVAQDFALDIVQVVDGSSHSGNAQDRSSYFAWGELLTAPADGVVATVVDDFPDQPIGSVDVSHPAGNHVALDVGGYRFVVFGHLQSGSIRVSVGDRVRRGDVIALIGNSGNSDEPHLHIQAQNSSTFDVLMPPVNLTTYPLLFDDMVVRRNGAVQHPNLADLRRGDTFQWVG